MNEEDFSVLDTLDSIEISIGEDEEGDIFDIFDEIPTNLSLIDSGLYNEAKEEIYTILEVLDKKANKKFVKCSGFHGYIRGRYFDDNNYEIEDLPLTDFFKVSRKAIPFDKSGKVNEKVYNQKFDKGLLDIFKGNVFIQLAIGVAFNVYCAAQYDLLIFINKYSRDLKVEPVLHTILNELVRRGGEKNIQEANELYLKYLTVRYLCFTFYEDLSLSGYKEENWGLWGRILGIESPSVIMKDTKYLSPEEASKARDSISVNSNFCISSFRKAKDNFASIYRLSKVDPNVPPTVISYIFRFYCMVNMYNALESGSVTREQLTKSKDLSKADINFNTKFIDMSLFIGSMRRFGRGILASKASTRSILNIKDITNVNLEEVLYVKRRLEEQLKVIINIDTQTLKDTIDVNLFNSRRRCLSQLLLDRIREEPKCLNLMKAYNSKTKEIEMTDIGSWFIKSLFIYERRIDLLRQSYMNKLIYESSMDPSGINSLFSSYGVPYRIS